MSCASRLKLANNDFIRDRLLRSDKAKLKLVQIFKSVATILYKDLMSNPWKLIFYMGPIPGGATTCGTLTALFHMCGITAKGREYRNDFLHACKNPINYKLYIDFMGMDKNHINVDTSRLVSFLKDQGKAHVLNNIYTKTADMKDGCLKNIVRRKIRKYVSKGELTVI